MQTRCPKCTTMVKSAGSRWEIIKGLCPELSGTQWTGKPEYCPILSQIAEPDVALPGASNRVAVQAEIDRARDRAPACWHCCRSAINTVRRECLTSGSTLARIDNRAQSGTASSKPPSTNRPCLAPPQRSHSQR